MLAAVTARAMPTDVDLESIRREIGVPSPGDIVLYDRLEEVLHLSRKRTRWRSVMAAWRRLLVRENNVYLKAISNVGFEALGNHGRVSESARGIRNGLRGVKRAGDMAATTDRRGLDSHDNRSLDHTIFCRAQFSLMERTAAREMLLAPDEVKALAAPAG